MCLCPLAAWLGDATAAAAAEEEEGGSADGASSSSVSEVAQVEDVLVAGAPFPPPTHVLTCQWLLASSATCTSATFPPHTMSGENISLNYARYGTMIPFFICNLIHLSLVHFYVTFFYMYTF